MISASILTSSTLSHDRCASFCPTTRSCTNQTQDDVAARAWLTPPISVATYDPRVSQAMTVEPDSMHRSFGGNMDLCLISLLSHCCDLASNLDVYSLPEVHATGSTVLLASRVTEMSTGMFTRTSRRGWTYVSRSLLWSHD